MTDSAVHMHTFPLQKHTQQKQGVPEVLATKLELATELELLSPGSQPLKTLKPTPNSNEILATAVYLNCCAQMLRCPAFCTHWLLH
jgi:hypothetical protein